MAKELDVSALLDSETDRVEWKESIRQREPILKAVCALANDLGDSGRPGYLVIGVTDCGDVVGVEAAGDIERQQRELSDRLRSTKILPTPSASVSLAPCRGHRVVVIEVEPYLVPPVVRVDGTAWVRVGSTTRRATEADLGRLNERRPLARQPFDLRPWAGATLDDLQRERLSDLHRSASEDDHDQDSFPDLERWLSARQLGTFLDGVWTPNPTAILLYGRSPQSFFPGARVDLVRYDGDDIDSPVSVRKTATGTLPDQLDALWAHLAVHVEEVPAPAEGIREAFVPTYPLEALKELVRNLVQHRLYEGTHELGRIEWYDDRIEFSNPGGPFGRASEGEFGDHADYRNPGITAGLVETGYVQQLGRGLRLVRSRLEKNGNAPLVAETDGFTRVIVRRRP